MGAVFYAKIGIGIKFGKVLAHIELQAEAYALRNMTI
jgi:hypothetical protein